MEEIKPVVTEKHHFANRDESFSILFTLKFWTARILMQQGLISIVFQANRSMRSEVSGRDQAGRTSACSYKNYEIKFCQKLKKNFNFCECSEIAAANQLTKS